MQIITKINMIIFLNEIIIIKNYILGLGFIYFIQFRGIFVIIISIYQNFVE